MLLNRNRADRIPAIHQFELSIGERFRRGPFFTSSVECSSVSWSMYSHCEAAVNSWSLVKLGLAVTETSAECGNFNRRAQNAVPWTTLLNEFELLPFDLTLTLSILKKNCKIGTWLYYILLLSYSSEILSFLSQFSFSICYINDIYGYVKNSGSKFLF